MNSQSGFTLIELVVVIVILGILAATAAPKFIDLTGDARKSVIEGVEGAMNSATDMAHAKALVAGETGVGPISAAGTNITLVEGWPALTSLPDLLDLDSEIGVSGGMFYHKGASTPATCNVTYTDTASKNVKPNIVATVTDCS
ncbi:MAG: type II secretion system protein [Alteromonadaceae bacterium]|nr:type II secretion system protein [Alteromonadaceae bacterium]